MVAAKKRRFWHNLKPGLLLVVIPLLLGLAAFTFLLSGAYRQRLAGAGSDRLITPNWELADQAFSGQLPVYERRFAYYQLKTHDTLARVARHFSVSEAALTALNPGTLAPGTSIKIPPPESPLAPQPAPDGRIGSARISEQDGIVQVVQKSEFGPIITDLPELARVLEPYRVLQMVAPKHYRLLKPLSIEGPIRLDITGDEVSLLELRSSYQDITCLCFENAEVLIRDTTITSYDPRKNGPDTQPQDLRSFVRARESTRMDIINSTLQYLGNGAVLNSPNPVLEGGGVFGVSWRISGGTLGKDIVTGWVENSTFRKNYFGNYSFGASGMTWRNNRFSENDVYGLDPHDDSNNALVEGNTFNGNGKHGFIVSVRCNYNIIRGNTSYDNGLHGFMLHKESAYNLLENNVAYDNTDNFVIFASDFNAIRGNKSYNARNNHVRVNKGTTGGTNNIFIIDNQFYGGKRGVYLYDYTKNVLVKGNTFQALREVISTRGAMNVLFTANTVPRLLYDIGAEDRVIFGPNTVRRMPTTAQPEVGKVQPFDSQDAASNEENL